MQTAREIVLEYPDEKENIYFVPGKPKTKTAPKTVSKGKLWSRYNYVKNKLGKWNAENLEENDESKLLSFSISNIKIIYCTKQNIRYFEKKISILTISAPNEASTSDVTNKEKDNPGIFQYLRSNIGREEEQLQNWSICHNERKTFLDSHSPQEYLNAFPALKVQFGYQLLLQDFDRNYEQVSNSLYSAWKVLSSAILKLGIKKKHFSQAMLQNPNGKLFYC